MKQYEFSFQPSYTYSNKLTTGNLNHVYYVNEFSLYDFRQQTELKLLTDDRVEDEVIRRLDIKCDESLQQHQSYLNQANRYKSHPEAQQMYQKKAEDVDLSIC